MDLDTQLQQGIAAAQAGDKTEARARLTQVVKADENQLEAWWWLSQVVDSLEEREICLENVLTLEPDHLDAQVAWEEVKMAQEKLFKPTYALGEEEPPPGVVTLPEAAHQPITARYPHQDEFDDEWLCPYCLAQTRPEDRICGACRQPLVLRSRVKTERSVWLWRGIFIQLVAAFFLVTAGIVYFVLFGKLRGVPNPFLYLPLYLGLPVDYPEQPGQIMLEVLPVWAFWGVLLLAFYSLALMILLYLRVPHGNTLYLGSASLMVALGVTGLLFFYDSYITLIGGGVLLLLGAGQMAVTLNIWPDFTFQEGRLRLKLDDDAKGHRSLFLSGRKYTKHGMWGLAMLHLRQATLRDEKNPLYHTALAVAYIQLQRYALANKALKQAEAQEPNSPEIQDIRQTLNALLH